MDLALIYCSIHFLISGRGKLSSFIQGQTLISAKAPHGGTLDELIWD